MTGAHPVRALRDGVRPRRTRRDRAPGRGSFGRLEVGGAIYVLAATALAAWAAWPVYASTAYLVLVGTAVGVAAVLAVLAHRFRWRAVVVAGSGLAALVVLGLVVAVPVYRVGVARAAGSFVAGLGTAWKDLLTVDLPVGDYRNLLVPALVVFLVGPLAALLLSWLRTRVFVAAAPVALSMAWFGLAFGADATTAPVRVGGVPVAAPREALLGGLSLLLALAWLTWRARAERTEALQRAARASGVRLARVRGAAALRASALVWLMVGLAVAVALVGTPVIASGQARTVLRSGSGPDLQVARAVSPLVGYRQSFADDRYDAVLFRVAATGAMPDRVRLATLTHYDGVVFSTSGEGGSTFRRVPYRRDPGAGERTSLTVTTGDLGTLWQPMAGNLASITFAGARAQSLGDGFYYDASTGSAVNTVAGGLAEGDSYTADVALGEPADVTALASPGHGPVHDVPDSLRQWLRAQDQPATGAGLAELASRLRERGYLSHALTVSGDALWVAGLGADYAFRLSTAGHSLSRIDALFTALNTREDAVADAGGTGSLVAAVGDDEQFAVALALVADQLGFPARVVVGTRLVADDGSGVPACTDGVCRGRNLTAWVEVQGADGAWAAVDATPQHVEDVAEETEQRRDPENPTQVRPLPAEEVDPPDPAGTRGDAAPPSPASGVNLAWLWAVLRIGAIGLLALLVLLGPALVVVAAKALRRRSRRHRPDPVARTTGGGTSSSTRGSTPVGWFRPTRPAANWRPVMAVLPRSGSPRAPIVRCSLRIRRRRRIRTGTGARRTRSAAGWRQEERDGSGCARRCRRRRSCGGIARGRRGRPRTPEREMTDVNALGQVAGTLVVLLVSLALYVWTSLALAGVFGKVGEERWQGWVPVWNTAVLLRIGGYSPWLVLLVLVPVLGAIALAVVLIMAFHRINTGFGYGAGMTVVAALWSPIWASVLAWGGATWSGGPVRPVTRPAWQPPPSAPAWAPPVQPSPVVSVEAGVSSWVGRAEIPGQARDDGLGAAETVAGAPDLRPSDQLPSVIPAKAGISVAPDSGSTAQPSSVGAEAGVASSVGWAEIPGQARDDGVGASETVAGAPDLRPSDQLPSVIPAEAGISVAPDSGPTARPSSVGWVGIPGQARDDGVGAAVAGSGDPTSEGRTPVPPPAGPRQWFPVPRTVDGADVADVGASEPSPVLSPTGPLSPTDPLSIGNWLTDTAAVTQWAGPEPSGSVPEPEPAPEVAPHIEPAPQPLPEPAAEPAPPAESSAPPADLRWAPPPEVFRAAPGVFGAAAPAPDLLAADPPAPAPLSAEPSADAVTGPEEPEEFDDRTVLASRLRPRWRLVAVTGEEFVLTGTEVLVGRLPAPDPAHPGAQVLPVSDSTRTVSKAHALLTLVDGRWLVSDLGSTNGVTLVAADGGERTIGPGTAVPLTVRFFLGDAEFALREVPPGS
ncbi:MAG: DUF5684 domain-containing protein [Propionicimonas sp.]|uniref:DUF5684 domain-containing protein n=1 Tax=Propionicimonas sp. TaxID=1955623 RepID=UPI003D14A983